MRSSDRARDLGEVFTPAPIVENMLDLLQDINYASKFLEPGCGNGNFLVEIVRRKVATVTRLPEVSLAFKNANFDEFDFKCVIAAGSIYGIDIDKLNISEARERTLQTFIDEMLKGSRRKELPDYVLNALTEILSHNIILGDMVNEGHLIEIVEYGELPNYKIKRCIFRFSDLIFPEDEVFEDNNLLFGHVPTQLRDLPAIPFKEIGVGNA